MNKLNKDSLKSVQLLMIIWKYPYYCFLESLIGLLMILTSLSPFWAEWKFWMNIKRFTESGSDSALARQNDDQTPKLQILRVYYLWFLKDLPFPKEDRLPTWGSSWIHLSLLMIEIKPRKVIAQCWLVSQFCWNRTDLEGGHSYSWHLSFRGCSSLYLGLPWKTSFNWCKMLWPKYPSINFIPAM